MRAVSSLQGREADCNWDRRPHECGGQAVRKHWCAEMVSVGPATEPEKEEEEEAKKGDRRRKRMLMSRYIEESSVKGFSSHPEKVVVKVDVHDDKDKKKAMKAVSSLQGIDSISMDMKDMKLTVIGMVDPIDVVGKLRKHWCADMVSVGPAKEPEKKKEEPKKGEEEKKKDPNEQIAELVKAYKAYNPCMTTYYYVQSAEENPNACVVM
ncbi:heavy metal-associated domain containing protein [Musa troglodytarum]|nr:heavy metal-associated domain containing protein [Musa troglodytarum]